jgi:AcrR family transcriptional regulator
MRPTPSTCRDRILSQVIPLFAEKGYSRVTMREAAQRAGIAPGSFYHHFPGKQALYLAAMQQAFAGRAREIREALAGDGPPEGRLRNLIHRFCAQLSRDPVFTRLIHREILDGDEKRLQLVVDSVFGDVFSGVMRLCKELAPSFDPFLLCMSIVSLTVYHYQVAGLRKFFPGSRPEHDAPERVAAHIVRLLLEGIGPRQKAAGVEPFQGDPST